MNPTTEGWRNLESEDESGSLEYRAPSATVCGTSTNWKGGPFAKAFSRQSGLFGCGAALLAALLLSSCTHAPLNAPLERYDPKKGYRFETRRSAEDKKSFALVLFFSGGGTRAAALSYGVLKELAATRMPGGDRMIDHVTGIGAVSGGSFSAAYYCLYGERIFDDFEGLFLKRNVQDELLSRCFSPAYAFKLMSSYYGRSDMASEYYDRLLFHGATFADLEKGLATRPYLMISATDMVTGYHFSFTQDAFDVLGSDLSTYPISRAVAASSAVPVLLTPITLQNYSAHHPQVALDWMKPDDGLGLYARRRRAIADVARTYLDAGKRPYIHLVDGGVADNLGLSDLFTIVMMYGGWDRLVGPLPKDGNARILLVVVNAATDVDPVWGEKERTPKLKEVVTALSRSAINRSNSDVYELVRESLDSWADNKTSDGNSVVRLVGVDFSQIPDVNERRFFYTIPTRFSLPPESVDRLVEVGGRLLRSSAEFQSLRKELAERAERKKTDE